ncbi:hypothetical protein [Luethyella okanaganae]|uniref:Uncharacterized protein n=1 Tax=Luethyella okanaganae TaxID=69372 RepID=A0ABW1VH24_9MICO
MGSIVSRSAGATAIKGLAKNGLRYGKMALQEPLLATRQFMSNPGARIQRMALQAKFMTPRTR